jgi:hypothetical protein
MDLALAFPGLHIFLPLTGICTQGTGGRAAVAFAILPTASDLIQRYGQPSYTWVLGSSFVLASMHCFICLGIGMASPALRTLPLG